MTFQCPACQKETARTDKRKRWGQGGWLKPKNGSRVRNVPGLAPSIHCVCGHAVILLRGSL